MVASWIKNTLFQCKANKVLRLALVTYTSDDISRPPRKPFLWHSHANSLHIPDIPNLCTALPGTSLEKPFPTCSQLLSFPKKGISSGSSDPARITIRTRRFWEMWLICCAMTDTSRQSMLFSECFCCRAFSHGWKMAGLYFAWLRLVLSQISIKR